MLWYTQVCSPLQCSWSFCLSGGDPTVDSDPYHWASSSDCHHLCRGRNYLHRHAARQIEVGGSHIVQTVGWVHLTCAKYRSRETSHHQECNETLALFQAFPLSSFWFHCAKTGERADGPFYHTNDPSPPLSTRVDRGGRGPRIKEQAWYIEAFFL